MSLCAESRPLKFPPPRVMRSVILINFESRQTSERNCSGGGAAKTLKPSENQILVGSELRCSLEVTE